MAGNVKKYDKMGKTKSWKLPLGISGKEGQEKTRVSSDLRPRQVLEYQNDAKR